VAEVVKNIDFRAGDFERTLADVKDGDYVYLDPPYYKLGGYSDFNRYTREQFRENDHIRLAAFCRELDERNVFWEVSNSDTAFVRRLFARYVAVEVSNRREINLNSRGRDGTELFIVNYPVRAEQPCLSPVEDEKPVEG
jgi:DNA adenine methylase